MPLFSAVAAFQAPVAPRVTSRQLMQMPLMSAADGMEGAAHETGNVVWDPLGLADLGSASTLAWFRHAELKHGRVSMAAFVGWLVAVSGAHFPGDCTMSGLSFEELSKLAPLDQWAVLPFLSKAQIFLFIGIVEHQTEWKIKPHYMKGGTPGDLKPLKSTGLVLWDPVGITSKLNDKKLARQRLSEVKNGRLAMLGIIGVLVANNLPGSIPVPIDFPTGPSFVLPL